MARDCPDRAPGANFRNAGPPRRIENGPDSEYEKLMNEIGGGEGQNPARQIGWEQDGAPSNDQANVRPWQRGPTGAPAPWAQNRQAPSNPAPWTNPNRGGYDGGYNNAPPPPPSGGGLPPWQQNRGGQGGAAPWAMNGNMGGGGGYGSGGYGGGAPPWQQQQQQYGEVPPPPPPSDVPPPPPSDVPPPPPPA